ncbi:AI-2E family transporter [Tuberibacillus sp. Marseille-P3662]|uniref:AI-2E family transporter n=1 Tax=Tuberibacillus sp. Marseille-P3662 TaxID=1965358 RepID=UPI000A1CB034|nr:AI-2E family transporter [Tuberibacillus sp. Marseille-P3662]
MKPRSSAEWLRRLSILLIALISVYMAIQLLPYFKMVIGNLLRMLTPFFIALLIAYLLHPFVNYLQRGMPRPVAILIIYTTFFGVMIYALIKGMPYVITQLKHFAEQIPDWIQVYRKHVNDIYLATSNWPETLHDNFDQILSSVENTLKSFIHGVVSWLQGLVKSFFTILLIPFLVFYFLKDADKMRRYFWHIVPESWRPTGRELTHKIDQQLGNFIRGQLLVCAALIVVAFIGLWFLDVPYPLILGMFIGITDIIPFFGPIIGAVPAILIAATVSVKTVILVGVLILVIQFLEGNIISPLIVGRSVHVHPVWIMLSLVVGETFAGILGLLLAVPIFLAIRVIVNHYAEQRKKIDKGI